MDLLKLAPLASFLLALCTCVQVAEGNASNPPTKSKAAPKNTVSRELPPAPEGVTILPNLPFLESGREELLDLYLPANRTPDTESPGVVIIHGGGWRGGDKSAAREFNIGTTLAKAGYVCASVEYLKDSPDLWPKNLLDCKNGVRFLRANAALYQVDPDHIGVIGGSAGGHLALMVAYTHGVKGFTPRSPYPGVSDHVQACVNMYGIADLLSRQSTQPDGTPTGQLRNSTLFSDAREENPDLWKSASPVSYISPATPPTLILHGMIDTTVDRDQSISLARKLKESGVEHELILLAGVGHTFDLQTWAKKPLPQDLRPVVTGFFDRHLKPRKLTLPAP